MAIFVSLLLWAHFIALAAAFGGGIGMSQIGPKLLTSTPEQRAAWWPLATAFDRIAGGGVVGLLITGPLMLWLKYGGMGGLSVWFHVKMGLVLLAIVMIGVAHMGMARLKRGDEGGGKLMAITGPLTMLVMLAIVLAAVLAFN